MTGRHETGTNLESESTSHQEQPAPASVETAYERLAGYGFARRYVRGKIVANIGREQVGYGSRLLAETAESVTALTSSPEAIELASGAHPPPNVSYQRADLPDLPLSEDSFDAVVALGVLEDLEDPEQLLREARRILKEGGVLFISAIDKHTNTIERNPGSRNSRGEMYVPEFQQMLERHFGQVRIYRQGAVAGGLVFPVTQEELGAVPVEVARSSVDDRRLGVGSPVTRSVIGVCGGDAGAVDSLGGEAYLLLERDRRVFDECEDRVEDVELLRDEVRRMQETEVQAFVDAIKVRKSLIQELPRYMPHMRNIILEHLIHRRNIIRGNIYAIRRKGAMGLARGALRRSSALYRRLQARTRDSD